MRPFVLDIYFVNDSMQAMRFVGVMLAHWDCGS
jgi:hypothetical protein